MASPVEIHRLPDGLCLTYAVYGDPDGVPVLALHGTPGARTKFASADAVAHTRGLRLIAVDRWGYAGTHRPSVPSLAGFGEDMARLCDGLGLDRVGVIGVSGGGPFAVAVASVLGRRAGALALIAPVGPVAGHNVRLSAFHRLCFKLLPRIPGGVRLPFAVLKGVLSASPTLAVRLVTSRAPAMDLQILKQGGAAMALAETFHLGFSGGIEGAVADMRLFSRPWGFDPGSIRSPARLWIGELDRNVPQEAAFALAAVIPGCEISRPRGWGHYWITRHIEDVVDWMAKVLGAGSFAAPEKRSDRQE